MFPIKSGASSALGIPNAYKLGPAWTPCPIPALIAVHVGTAPEIEGTLYPCVVCTLQWWRWCWEGLGEVAGWGNLKLYINHTHKHAMVAVSIFDGTITC